MADPYAAADGLVRVYPAREPNGAGLVWAHGGAFAFGDLDMPEADWVARSLATRGTTVVSVDYRLAPTPAGFRFSPDGAARDGFVYPAGSDDILAAWSWTVDNAARLRIDPERLAIGGASAGGNLAAGAVLRLLASDAEPCGPRSPCSPTRRFSPFSLHRRPSCGRRSTPTPRPTASAPRACAACTSSTSADRSTTLRCSRCRARRRPTTSPEFPPTLMINGEVDELRVSGEFFAATLAAAGREVEVVTEAGTTHGHLNNPQLRRGIRLDRSHRDAPRRSALAASPSTRPLESPLVDATRRPLAASLGTLTDPNSEPRTNDMTNPAAAELIARSNRLGADPKNTNYAGGNTSAKGTETDPVTGEPVELLWVKGSGGDLGTLKEAGLAVLRLDRLRALTGVYPGVEREDEMVAAFDYCLHGKGGAAPSIDTAMHGLVDAAHVDHLHPDSGIAIATAADGEALTANDLRRRRSCVGAVASPRVPARARHRRDQGRRTRRRSAASSAGTASPRGATRPTRPSRTRSGSSTPPPRTSPSTARPTRSAASAPGSRRCPRTSAAPSAAALAPTIRGLASHDKPQVGHYTDSDVVLDFLASASAPRLAALGTSCPDHFLRTKVKPLILDLPASATVEEQIARLHELHEEYRADYQAYYDAHATAESPAIRGADPLIVLIPGVGMFSYGANKQTARVAGEFYVNAINVMRGAESLSTYAPISDAEKFNIEYWALEEAKLQRMPKPKTHQGRIAFVTGAASGIGKAIAVRLAAEGACVVVADLDLEKAQAAAAELGGTDVAIGVAANVADAAGVQAAIDATVLAFGGVDLVVNNAGLSLSKPLLETTEKDWDLQHDVMAKGSFLVSKAAAKVLIEQKLGGDVIYISSKNSVFAGPNNIAYSATKADQAHQVRLLAVELGEHGVRVNGINPDGVVRGSGIFAAGWGANRAATYGVKEEDLGQYYANRTILKREVVPENVADAVYVLTGPELSRTTGLHIPVDSGVAAAFLR